MDGSELTLHTPDSANHEISLSPEGSFFVDYYSTPVDPPVTVVCNLENDEVMAIEKADISRLLASGWVAPEPFIVKARDGKTDLYGLMHKPSDFDPSGQHESEGGPHQTSSQTGSIWEKKYLIGKWLIKR